MTKMCVPVAHPFLYRSESAAYSTKSLSNTIPTVKSPSYGHSPTSMLRPLSTANAPLSSTSRSSYTPGSTARLSQKTFYSDAEATETANAQNTSNSGGLNTASEVGSVVGAIFGGLAVMVAVYFGVKELRKRCR